jgi:hypothetical protein
MRETKANPARAGCPPKYRQTMAPTLDLRIFDPAAAPPCTMLDTRIK